MPSIRYRPGSMRRDLRKKTQVLIREAIYVITRIGHLMLPPAVAKPRALFCLERICSVRATISRKARYNRNASHTVELFNMMNPPSRFRFANVIIVFGHPRIVLIVNLCVIRLSLQRSFFLLLIRSLFSGDRSYLTKNRLLYPADRAAGRSGILLPDRYRRQSREESV